MELYYKYSDEVKQEDLEIAKDHMEEDDDEELEVEIYMRRLEHGLFALQSICYIILDISANGPSGIGKRLGRLLNLRKEPYSRIVEVVKTYVKNLGDEEVNKSNATYQEEKERIENLIEKFEKSCEK